MSRIVYLKQLGFSLEEISELFADGKEFPDAELLKVKIEPVSYTHLKSLQKRQEFRL